MPKIIDLAPARNGTFEWIRVYEGSPKPSTVYKVKHRLHGAEFWAWHDHNDHWWIVEADANGDGTRELGARIRSVLDLYFEARV